MISTGSVSVLCIQNLMLNDTVCQPVVLLQSLSSNMHEEAHSSRKGHIVTADKCCQAAKLLQYEACMPMQITVIPSSSNVDTTCQAA